MRTLVLLDEKELSAQYESDITRIITICAARGFKIRYTTALRAWKSYSELCGVLWRTLPDKAEYVFRLIQVYTKIKEEDEREPN